jgi:hypothetical protein
MQVDDVEGQFLDFLQQFGIHLAEVNTVVLNLLCRRYVGQVTVDLYVLFRGMQTSPLNFTIYNTQLLTKT